MTLDYIPHIRSGGGLTAKKINSIFIALTVGWTMATFFVLWSTVTLQQNLWCKEVSTVLSEQCTAVHNWFRGEHACEQWGKWPHTSTSHGSVHVRLMVLAVEPAGGAGSMTSPIQTYAWTGNSKKRNKRKLSQVELILSPDERIRTR